MRIFLLYSLKLQLKLKITLGLTQTS
jgi:hypothetical protein